ncbi:chemotaxis protein CheW [uncultured Desulfuromusa sp.]|uniref:chemotaxis protein CheW n=1 Tax=uncultured Desulfuromusa sp. TaxID=219183 RepID=UPI002AA68F82|nr:chemotaxis protein CheW [uncultured Desulfuromusa sp.]
MTEVAELDREDIQIHQDSMEGMYLTFELANEGYGLEIRYVIEIIGIQTVIKIPDMPEHVIGVLNLRGKVIPVIDVRMRFHLPTREYDDRTCIIVVNVNNNSVGLVVDNVSEVVDIPEVEIEPPPSVGRGSNPYIQYLGKIAGEVKILLDVNELIDDDVPGKKISEPEAV